MLSLPHLRHVIFGMGAANQLVQDTLNRVTMLKIVDAPVPKSLELVFARTEADKWQRWSRQHGVEFFWHPMTEDVSYACSPIA